MDTFTLKCVKPGCDTTYTSTDPDPYYCQPHIEEKKQLAAQIDAQVGSRPKRPTTSALQEYDAAQKVHGFVQAKL